MVHELYQHTICICALKIANLVPFNLVNDVHFHEPVALCGKESLFAVSNIKEKGASHQTHFKVC